MDTPGFFGGAVATPVYVEVDGRPARNEQRLGELVAARMQCLDDIERWLAAGEATAEPGGIGGWESAEALRGSVPEIRRQVQAARNYFTRLVPPGKAPPAPQIIEWERGFGSAP